MQQVSDSGATSRHWPNAPAYVYFIAAAGGLIGTAVYNIQGAVNPMGGPGAVASTLFGNPLSASLTIDLLVAASAASVFMLLEGRRLGMRLPWLYVVGSFVTAIAFTFPLFLAMRERRLSANERTADH